MPRKPARAELVEATRAAANASSITRLAGWNPYREILFWGTPWKSPTITTKGQVTILKSVRQQLGLKRGSRVAFVVEGDHAVLRPASLERALPKSGFGMVKVSGRALPPPNVTVEDRLSVEAALASHRSGLDFADALHHATYRTCNPMANLDERKFARRASKLGLVPTVTVPR